MNESKPKPTRTPGTIAAAERKVAIAAGAGMPHEEIAAALGISVRALVDRYSDALARGAYQRRVENVVALYKAAQEGSVHAQRAYAAGIPQVTAPKPEPEEKAKPLGKKEQANEDAKTAAVGSDWDELLPTHRATLQ